MSDDLQSLVIRAIESYARVETRVGGLEESIRLLREENKILRDESRVVLSQISDSLKSLATVQEKMLHISEDHKIIHRRIDDVKDEIEATEALVLGIQHNCQLQNCPEIARRLGEVERTLTQLCDNLKLVNYKVGKYPIWLIFVALIIFGIISDIANHRKWLESFKFW